MKRIYGNCQKVGNVCLTRTDPQRVFGSFIQGIRNTLVCFKMFKTFFIIELFRRDGSVVAFEFKKPS